MTTHTELDLTVIEALDFQPPCEVVNFFSGRACGEPAEWIVTTLHHCKDGVTKTRFLCGGCLARWQNPLSVAVCGDCLDKVHDLGDRIIRTERIGA